MVRWIRIRRIWRSRRQRRLSAVLRRRIRQTRLLLRLGPLLVRTEEAHVGMVGCEM